MAWIRMMPALHRQLSIRTQLIVGFALILALNLVSSLIGYGSLRTLQTSMQATLEQASLIREYSQATENEFLLARQHEASFLASWSSIGFEAAHAEYVSATRQHLAQARAELDALDRLLQSTDSPDIKGLLQETSRLRPLLNDYEDAFLATVAKIERRSSANGLEQSLRDELDQLAADVAPLPNSELHKLVLQMRAHEQAYFNTHNQQYIDSIRLAVEQFRDVAERSSAADLTAGASRLSAADLVQRVDRYFATFTELVELEREVEINTVIFRDITTDINEITARVGEVSAAGVTRAREELERQSGRIQTALTLTVVLSLVLASLAAFVLARRIIRPLSQLSQAAEQIGQGNLDQVISAGGGDEFAKLAGVFNTMAARLRELIGSLEQRVAERTRDLSRRSLQLETAAQVAGDAASVLEPQHLLERVVQLIRDQFGFYHTAIFLLDERGEWAILQAAASSNGIARPYGSRVRVGPEGGLVGIVADQGMPRIASESDDGQVTSLQPWSSPDVRSEMALPLVARERVLGVLDVHSTAEHAFSEEDLRVLQLLANQIAIAMNNAELFQVAQSARAAAEEANRLKTQFLANMSHELRTPLNAIINYTKFVQNPTDTEDPQTRSFYLERVLVNAEHLLGLINDILDLSKIEAGLMELSYEQVQLAPLLQGVMSTAVGLTKDKGLALELDVSDDLPAVWIDSMRIRQVLLNLLSNAAKFTNEGGITVRAYPTGDGFVTIEVKDTGIGIAPEHHELIFEDFRQVQHELTREYQGTGLGLPISKRIVEMHGGRMWLESALGEGSTFFFTLPVASVFNTSGAQASGGVGGELAEAAPLILVVDDEQDSQYILRTILQGAGYRVHSIFDSRVALQEIRRVQPQLVILDLRMPHVDGWSLLAEMRMAGDLAHIPVLICSVIEPQQKQLGVLNGISAYLVKPVRAEDLLALVSQNLSLPATVLVVDDDDDARRVVRRVLESARLRVIESSSGRDALAMLRQEHPDLLILDLMMPEVDGFAVLEQIRSSPDLVHLPVAIVTAKDLTAEERQWLQERTFACLQKTSFNNEELLTIVRMMVEKGVQHG